MPNVNSRLLYCYDGASTEVQSKPATHRPGGKANSANHWNNVSKSELMLREKRENSLLLCRAADRYDYFLSQFCLRAKYYVEFLLDDQGNLSLYSL